MTGVPASWVVPDGLPDGGYIIPDPPYHDGEPITEPALWITDEPVPDVRLGPMFARLLAAHGDTGLWPLLLTEMSAPAGVLMPVISGVSADLIRARLYPPGRPWHEAEILPVPASRIDELDAGELLARDWNLEVSTGGERFSFGADAFPGLPRLSWPGLADPASPGADPDAVAASLVTAPGGAGRLTMREDIYLGLVPASDGAAAITACGWLSNAGDTAEIAAVIRSWQRRFGVRLCAIGFDTLGLCVAWPPATAEHARRVAAEHVAFCPEIAYHVDVADYAHDLEGNQVWPFWWD